MKRRALVKSHLGAPASYSWMTLDRTLKSVWKLTVNTSANMTLDEKFAHMSID